jgi:hypothetical protein
VIKLKNPDYEKKDDTVTLFDVFSKFYGEAFGIEATSKELNKMNFLLKNSFLRAFLTLPENRN